MTVSTSSRVSVSPGGFEQAKLIQECNGSLYNFQSWLCRFGHFPLFMREVVKMVGHLWSWLFVVVVVVLRGGAHSQNFGKLLLDSSCLSICPLVRLCACPRWTTRFPLDGFWWNFMFLDFFPRKAVIEIQISLKYDKNNRFFTWRPMYIYSGNYGDV